MAIYDVRYLQKKMAANTELGHLPRNSNEVKPLVTFPEYKNDAHVYEIGLDVLLDRGTYTHGAVAAAHDDGRVGLYSLYDGSRLRSPVLDAINVSVAGVGTGTRFGSGAAAEGGGVVKTLMFSEMPGDSNVSLFIGEGGTVKKYSLGLGKGEDEWV